MSSRKEKDINYLLCCSHNALQGLAAGNGVGTITVMQLVRMLLMGPVEGVHIEGPGSTSSQFLQKVVLRLGFLASDVLMS